ncbi:MAG TPA: LacI family DNA-binding transcriptional regulator [Gemmatimonadaceae bacterium]|nr:LacI family DNA-binding transcriptional regulator [Gemmatimonadaceae bacterium]
MQRATIQDVAVRAGVSISTVSAVLNDRTTVKESTRDQVLEAIRELNYRPRPALRRPASAPSTRSVAFIFRDAGNPYYDEVMAGAQDVLEQHGYHMLVGASDGIGDRERKLVDLLRAKDFDGVLLTPVLDRTADLAHLFELKRRNVSFVLLEEVYGIQASLVDVDSVMGSKKAVQHLIGLGHSHIVHFAGPEYSHHSSERTAGVRAAYSESSLVFSSEYVIPAGDSLQEGYESGLAYFRGRPPSKRPTAITCYNDLVAIGVCRALAELGLRVPDDVSIVGYDDLPLLDFISPHLTTVQVPKRDVGRLAAEMLHQEIEHGPPATPRKVYLQPSLVVRESTAPPRK